MKKILLVLSLVLVIGLFGCQKEGKEKLYVLNWGEYINFDLVEQFEKEFDVVVVYEEVGSNEQMYEKIKSGNTSYDIAIPSDYMISKLNQEELLVKIDTAELPNYKEVTINHSALSMLGEDQEYTIPYFWGTVGIMYNNDLKALVEEYGYKVLFDSSILPEGTKVGMYDSSRDAIGAALIYLGYDVNSTDEEELQEAQDVLANFDYTLWGEDNLKAAIIEGNLDLSLVYSGDYFDEYYIAKEEEREFNFGYFAPWTTNVWVDGMVIPTTSQNTEIAHKFINFMIDKDNAFENADYVGYAPVIDEVYQEFVNDEYYYDVIMNSGFKPFFESEDFEGQIYKYISKEHDEKLEDVLNKAKSE